MLLIITVALIIILTTVTILEVTMGISRIRAAKRRYKQKDNDELSTSS